MGDHELILVEIKISKEAGSIETPSDSQDRFLKQKKLNDYTMIKKSLIQ